VTRVRRMMLDELQRRNYSEITTRKNADPSVCSLSVDTLSSNSPLALLQARAALSTISTKPIECAGALPALDWVPNCHSNPITQRVRRRRQRLPPSLLIENASGLFLALPGECLPEAFPIKASDHPGANSFLSECASRQPGRARG